MRGENWYANLPKKRMAAGALIFNSAREILIVKPTYRDEWLCPGGVVESDESPRQACIREVREEIGIDFLPERLLCLEYLTASSQRTEALHFIFFGGVLADDRIRRVRTAPGEIADYTFASLEEAATKLPSRLARRIELSVIALDESRTIYAEDGQELL